MRTNSQRLFASEYVLDGAARFVLPVFAGLILIVPVVLALEGIAALTVLAVIARNHMARQPVSGPA